MKKILSLVLVVVMMMSMTVTAFAAVGDQSGTSTVTAVVPEAVPEYTIHIPADVTLEYGNDQRQLVGKVFVTDVKNLADGKDIDVFIKATPLKSTEGNEIPAVFEYGRALFNEEYRNIDSYIPVVYEETEDKYIPAYLFAQVTEEAWIAAKPGTYTSTITYSFYI